MANNNYFSVCGTPFFFDDASLESTSVAYGNAKVYAEEMRRTRHRKTGFARSAAQLISVYRRTRVPGVWGYCGVIGVTSASAELENDDSLPSFDPATGRPHPFSGE